MNKIYKLAIVILNLANLASIIAAAIIMAFKADFAVVVPFENLPGYAQLFLNLLMFQAGIVAITVLMSTYVKQTKDEIIFPIIYMILPIIASLVCGYFGIVSQVMVEKIVVIVGAVIYVVLTAVLLYFSTKTIENLPKKSK